MPSRISCWQISQQLDMQWFQRELAMHSMRLRRHPAPLTQLPPKV
jgi:hypothetical protein